MDRRPPLAVSPRRLRPRPHRVPRPPLVPASSSSSVQTPPGSMKKAGAAAPMRASVCAIPSPVRFEPSPMRASVCAIPSPVRFEPSPMRASISALPSPIRADPSPMRASMTSALQPPRRVKLDLTYAATRAAAAAEKENVLPAAAAPRTPPAAKAAGFEKESLLPPGADAHDELVALNLAAIARTAGGPQFVRGRLYDLYSARRNERLKRKQGFPYSSEEFAPAAASVDAEAMAEVPCVAVELSKRRVAKKAAYYTASGAESVRRSMPAVDFAAGRGGGLGPRSSLRSSKEMKKASAASASVSVAIKERRVNPRSSARRF